MAQFGNCPSFSEVGKSNAKVLMIKHEDQEVDRDYLQNWGVWILLQAEQEVIGSLALVGKPPGQIYGLGLSYWMQCKNN